MTENTDHFNKDELEAPAWLNKEFFAKVLHTCQKDNSIKVNEIKLSPATVKGDHYASVMFRATVGFDSAKKTAQSMSMILKTMPEVEGHKKEMLQESFIFETEIAMYTEVIPKFESMLRQIGDETIMGARCLYHSLSPKKLIIFEDIVPLGYATLRDRQVNLEEAKLAYSKLAKWHALSYKIHQQNPTYFDEFSHSFMEFTNDQMNTFLDGGIALFRKMLAEQPTLMRYKHYFDALEPELVAKCKASFREYRAEPRSDAHYVLCHGDFHFKNMMFKRSSEHKLEDLMLLDYQLCYVGPIVNDIIYSIYMMLDRELRKNHLDELLRYYFCVFLDTLEKIGFEGKLPRYIEFRQMLMRHSHFEIFLLVTFLPMWYAFQDATVETDQLMESMDFRRTMYSHKDYIAELEDVLPKYLLLGYLDK